MDDMTKDETKQEEKTELTLKEKLEKEIEKASWQDLEPHHKREALFKVDFSLELSDVGVAVAQDDVSSVKSWLESNMLARPTDSEIEEWQNEKANFEFVIIQPYVIMKKK